MPKFILAACLYFGILFAFFYVISNDQVYLLTDLALDQAEFNQSLSELADLQKVENSP